jgi:hypothetical protein
VFAKTCCSGVFPVEVQTSGGLDAIGAAHCAQGIVSMVTVTVTVYVCGEERAGLGMHDSQQKIEDTTTATTTQSLMSLP